MKNTNILALVPARLGSKGMPRKNLTMVGGKPLYAWAVEQGRRAVGNVILSTDIEEIREHEEYIRSEEILWRPSALASDSSTMNDVVRHTIDSLRLDSSQIIVLLQPTSPLRTVEDINSALAIFRKDEAEVVLSVVKEKNEAMKWGVMDAEKFVQAVKDSEASLAVLCTPPCSTTLGTPLAISLGLLQFGRGVDRCDLVAERIPAVALFQRVDLASVPVDRTPVQPGEFGILEQLGHLATHPWQARVDRGVTVRIVVHIRPIGDALIVANMVGPAPVPFHEETVDGPH